MKSILFATFLLLFTSFTFSQEMKVNVKKEKLYINDTPVCIIDKIKKGFLSTPNFSIKSLDEKPLGMMENHVITGPVTGQKAWFTIKLSGIEDSVLLSMPDVKKYNTSTLVDYSESFGKIIAKYNLIKNNEVNPEGFKLLKEENNTNYAQEYTAIVSKEQMCASHKNDPASSNAAQPVTVLFIKTDTVSKSTVTMYYDILQNDVKLGAIIVRGFLKSAKEEDAEYDYSPGMFSLDLKGGPMYYEINKEGGCFVANYNGEERYLFTWKDGLQTKSGDLKKFNKDGVKSRLAYLQAITNFLVQKRYL